jgi:hypothetical protein
MPCLVNRIPEILNIEGIRKDKKLINYFKTIPKLDPTVLKAVSQDFYSTIGINDPLLLSFIEDTVSNINDNKNMFTTMADTSQCTTAIGPEQFGDTCYLCGFALLPRGPRGIGSDTKDPFYPECEHVLPYIYGALYLNLITSKKEFDSLPIDVQRLSRIEYKWSHKCCNQIKSQAPFVKYTSDFQFIEDDDNIRCFLDELYEGKSTWANQFQENIAIMVSDTDTVNNTKFKEGMRQQKNSHYPVLKQTITNIVNNVSSLTDGEVNFLRSILIISFVKYIKRIYTSSDVDLRQLKSSITPGVRSYILKAWDSYRLTFQSLFQDTNRLTDSQIFSSYVDADIFRFGRKTNKIRNLSNEELKTKLKSVGINVTKISSKGKRLNLTRKEMEKKANLFKNLQLRAKKMGIKIMYKSRTRGYMYKSYTRLMNELEKLKQMKKSMKFG